MADTTDVTQSTGEPDAAQPARRLNQALTWVGIVAGGLFIVAAIFLSGFFLNWSEHAHMRMGGVTTAHEMKDCCADMKSGDYMMKPGAMGPEMMGPHQGS